MAGWRDALSRIIMMGHGEQPKGLYTPAPPRGPYEAVYPGTPGVHGSPIDWPQPYAFDPNKFGTGELGLKHVGPRAETRDLQLHEGHGHYLGDATTPAGIATAVDYRARAPSGPEYIGPLEWIKRAAGNKQDAARSYLESATARELPSEMIQRQLDLIHGAPGGVYQTMLRMDKQHMLDLDKRLGEQSPFVQARTIAPATQLLRGKTDLRDLRDLPDLTGRELVKRMGDLAGQPATADTLSRWGLPASRTRDTFIVYPGREVDKPGLPGLMPVTGKLALGGAVTGGAAAMGALAAPDEAQAARTPATQPMGSVAAPSVESQPLTRAPEPPPPELRLPSISAPSGRVPMPMTGMTNRNTLMNPQDPIAQQTGDIAQRYTDYVNTAGNLLWGTDPRFTVKPQKSDEWSEYDAENALRVAHELTRRAEVTALDATTGGIPRVLGSANELGVGGGRIIIPRRQEGVGGGSSPSVMGSVAKPPETPFPQYATQYPPVGPPTMLPKDKPKFPGETYPAKQWTPEAAAFMKERARIVKDMQKKGYEPYFDPEARYDANPANFPQTVDTTQIVPKKLDTIAKHFSKVGAPEVRQRMQDAYAKGAELGAQGGGRSTTADWYQMGQLADVVGPQAFRENFSLPMAATTGGMKPQDNLLAASYQNYLRARGEPWPEANQWPVPVGARYGDQLAGAAQDFGASGPSLTHPKRTNFASNFEGHTNHPTLDEQMSQLMQGKMQPDWYGINEHILGQEAGKLGVDPRRAQEVMWAGQKGEAGGPMISTVNDAIERTRRLTGMAPDEIVQRVWGNPPANVALRDWRIPLYGTAGVAGTGAMMGDLARQPRQNELPPLEVLEQ